MEPSTATSRVGHRRIRDYFRRYKRGFALGVVCLIITQAFALSAPQLLRIATDALVDGDGAMVTNAALGLLGVAVAGAVARILSRILIFNSGRSVEFDIRNDCFGHLETLSPSFYQGMPLGQVMSRMVNDLTQVRLILGPGILNLTNTALVYVVVIPLLFLSDAELATLALLPLPLLLLLGRAFARRLYTYNRLAQDKLGKLSTKVQENLSGVMTVRAYRQEEREEQVFTDLNEDYLDTNIRLAKLRGVMFPMMGIAGAIGLVVVLYFGGLRIVNDQMSLGDFVQFNAYLAALTWPTIALGWMISLWQRGLSAMDRLNHIFEATPTLVDGPSGAADYTGRIEVKNLTVSYGSGRRPALFGISTTIEPGESVVLVGRTGSGKSTLLKALARQIEVPARSIFVDGADVTELPLAQVRAHLGFAPQDAFLFSRTIYENISFGVPDAPEEDVREAARIACLDSDIAGFPDEIDTIVGERGVTLSGGQRQRTTLARALLVSPRLLILDDTLSAVDTETETRILDGLSQSTNRTTIVATHRLAFAARADRILVLEDGALVEQGTEEELLALGGRYAAMHRRQRLRESLERSARQPEAPRKTGSDR